MSNKVSGKVNKPSYDTVQYEGVSTATATVLVDNDPKHRSITVTVDEQAITQGLAKDFELLQEKQTRANQVAALDDRIDNETSSRLSADITLGNRITTIENSYVTSVNGNAGAITGVAKTNVANIFTAGQEVPTLTVNQGIADVSYTTVYLADAIKSGDNTLLLPAQGGTFALTSDVQSIVDASIANFSDSVVHLNGDETIAGYKTFSDLTTFNDGIQSTFYNIGLNSISCTADTITFTITHSENNVATTDKIYLPINSGIVALTSDLDTKADKTGSLPTLPTVSNYDSLVGDYFDQNNAWDKPVVFKCPGASESLFVGYINKSIVPPTSDTYVVFKFEGVASKTCYTGSAVIDLSTFTFRDMLSSTYHQQFEIVENKVSTFQRIPDNDHYPTEKLVYDNLQRIQELYLHELDVEDDNDDNYYLNIVMTDNEVIQSVQQLLDNWIHYVCHQTSYDYSNDEPILGVYVWQGTNLMAWKPSGGVDIVNVIGDTVTLL